MPTSIVWDVFTLPKGLAELNPKLHERLVAIMEFAARDMEAYAKSNAPWKDETGNARNGLNAHTEIAPLRSYAATLSHGVPYGIWLETRWAGRYAIIGPTVAQQEAKTAALLSGLMDGL